jgi:predicted Kef-type K+ transport protein
MYSQVLAAQVLITKVRARAAAARREGRSEIGASAIEWAIISAIVVALALLIAAAIRGVVDSNINKIDEGN